MADYIRGEMEKCTQLLAIISIRTSESPWVPWEIGVATEKERPLASFVSPPAAVPDFLRKWPYLQTLTDVAAVCRGLENHARNPTALVAHEFVPRPLGERHSANSMIL